MCVRTCRHLYTLRCRVVYMSETQTQTHTIAGHTVQISEAPRFNRNRPAKYIFTIVGAADYAQNFERTYRTIESALDAARQDLGATPVTGACARCDRPATKTAALGPACDQHYDDLAA